MVAGFFFSVSSTDFYFHIQCDRINCYNIEPKIWWSCRWLSSPVLSLKLFNLLNWFSQILSLRVEQFNICKIFSFTSSQLLRRNTCFFSFLWYIYYVCILNFLNPLNPKSDQHPNSPCNNTTESFITIMRIKEMIANLRCFDCKTNSPCQD